MGDVDSHAPERLAFRELDSPDVARYVFARVFGHPPPLDGHHMCMFLHDVNHVEHVACYIHFRPRGEILLGGGACVDTRMMRQMPAALRREIRFQGGLYQLTLRWALKHFAARYKAIFGYCGDALAERADRAEGFVDTGHEHLLVNWLADCDAATRRRLIAEAHAVGPF